MFLLIAFFVLSIVFSFLCSIWEAVLLSITPSYAEQLKTEAPSIGNRLASFKADIDRPLSAILTLNTLAHTVGAIGVGAQASKIWADADVNILGFHTSGEAVVAAVMTFAILIFSEIIPKTIGATFWKPLTKFTVSSLQLIIWILYPLVWLSKWITGFLKKDKKKSVLSRTDFSMMAKIGAREGVIKADEYRVLSNLLRFDEVRAKDIMTPRTVLVSADETETIGNYYASNKLIRFSRIPVYQEKVDNTTGYFLKTDLMTAMIEKKDHQALSSLKREFIVVNEVESIAKVFEKLIEQREHIALVVDEYGGVAGIVTTEDIVETLFGLEIMDEVDDTADMQSLAREQWKKRAGAMGIVEKE